MLCNRFIASSTNMPFFEFTEKNELTDHSFHIFSISCSCCKNTHIPSSDRTSADFIIPVMCSCMHVFVSMIYITCMPVCVYVIQTIFPVFSTFWFNFHPIPSLYTDIRCLVQYVHFTLILWYVSEIFPILRN